MIPDGVEFREGSCDALVFDEIWVDDVYRMATFPPAKEGQAALDLGANVGAWTLRALYDGCGDVVAVEPIPDNAKQLRENLSAGPSGVNVEVIEAACVGEDVAELRMIFGDEKFPSISYQAATGPVGIEVVAVHIDTLLAMRSSWWMMKCDIEGGEHSVLRGVDLRLLNRVDYLTMEFHGPNMGQHTGWIGRDWLGDLVTRLTEWGSIQTLGAASRGGMIYGWRYGVEAPHMWP